LEWFDESTVHDVSTLSLVTVVPVVFVRMRSITLIRCVTATMFVMVLMVTGTVVVTALIHHPQRVADCHSDIHLGLLVAVEAFESAQRYLNWEVDAAG